MAEAAICKGRRGLYGKKAAIPAYRLLAPDDMNRLHESALSVLEEVGCRIHNRRLLAMLADQGARVDMNARLARLPAHLVTTALQSLPSRFTLYNRERKPSLEMGAGEVYTASGHGALYLLDIDTGERRPASKADVAGFALLSDALDNIHFVAPVVFPRDVPVRSSILHALGAIFSNTRKHVFFCAETGEAARACFDLVRIVAGEQDLSRRPVISFQLSPKSPLVWTPEAADQLVAAAEARVPICVLASAMAGVSAPYTLAGTLALHHAETLSGLAMAQLLQPGLPCIYSTAVTDFDMRQANAALSTPETVLLSMGSLQLARLLGLPTHSCFPDTESHCHDQQQAWEKTWTTMGLMLAGGDMLVNAGMFSSGLTASYEQLLLDDEMSAGLHRLRRGFAVSDETIALDTIRAVGPGGSFLGEEHTIRHLRTGEHWQPWISNRAVYDTWLARGGRDAVAVARERARELLAHYRPEPLDPKVQEEMGRVITAFEAADQDDRRSEA